MLYLISKLSISIISNLDLENLLNSAITLIHQNFNYSRVSIYSVAVDLSSVNRFTITDNGVEKVTGQNYTGENDPVSWVLAHKELLVINNYSTNTNLQWTNQDPEVKSELALPLYTGNQYHGVLDFCSNRTDDFPPSTIEALKILADNIAIGIRNAKLFTREEIKNQAAQSFIDIIGDLSVELSQQEVINKILFSIEKYIPYTGAAIWLFENSTADSGIEQFISPARLAGVRLSDSIRISMRQPEGDIVEKVQGIFLQFENDPNEFLSHFPWMADIIEQTTPLTFDSLSFQDPLGKVLSLSAPYSITGIPLIIKDKSVGFIILIHNQPGHSGVDYMEIAPVISIYSTMAIEDARMISAAHDQSWMAIVHSQITKLSQSYTNVQDLLESTARFMVQLAGVHACSFYLWDDTTQEFYPQTAYGFDAEQQSRLDAWGVISESIPAYFELIASNKPVVLNASTLSVEYIELLFPGYDFQTNLLVLFPMVYQDKIMGTALIDFSGSRLDQNSPQKIWDDMFSVLQEVLQSAAGTIANLLRLKTSEEEAYISVALLQVAQAVVSMNKLDEILGLIVRITPILVGVKRCAIYLWDSTYQAFRLSQHYGFSKTDLMYEDVQIKLDDFPLLKTIYEFNHVAYHYISEGDLPLSWSEIDSSDLMYIEDVSLNTVGQSEIKLDPATLRSHTRLLIGFPLSVKGDVLGVMLIEEDEPNKGSLSAHIREKRIEIVNGITQQAAIAIQNEYLQQEIVNSERMERELQLARDIQKAFLPHHLPDIPGWDMDIRWQPAREVGGDFYDIILHEDNKMGFVVADVADKGMPAALFMTLIRTLIRAAAREYNSPAKVLGQVNELLLEDSLNGMFVTVFYCVIKLEDGKIVYANAGHNPPIVKYAQSKEIIELTRTSMALGLFPDIEIDEQELTLVPGDGILLYTDGITEAFSPVEEMFGAQRLLGMVQQLPFHTSSGLLDDIEKEVYDFIGSAELSDDITLAAIKFKDLL